MVKLLQPRARMCGSCCAYKSAAVDKFLSFIFVNAVRSSELNELLSQPKVAQGATQPLVEEATCAGIFIIHFGEY